jgi:hypothetical protein
MVQILIGGAIALTLALFLVSIQRDALPKSIAPTRECYLSLEWEVKRLNEFYKPTTHIYRMKFYSRAALTKYLDKHGKTNETNNQEDTSKEYPTTHTVCGDVRDDSSFLFGPVYR